MVSRRTNPPQNSGPRGRRATTPQAREQQLISLAVDEAERQMREGTASSQVITHYLKLGSSRERLEQEKLALESELLVTKKEAMESVKRVESIYGEALNAMRSYQTGAPLMLPDEDDDDY